MRPDQRRLVRLQRLETVRGIAKMTAARESAEAESALSQYEVLAARTGRLVADYATRIDATDGSQLRQLALFRERLGGISRSAQADVVAMPGSGAPSTARNSASVCSPG